MACPKPPRALDIKQKGRLMPPSCTLVEAADAGWGIDLYDFDFTASLMATESTVMLSPIALSERLAS